jgi:FlaA1/EpsC-like NDP-sugar epimerase
VRAMARPERHDEQLQKSALALALRLASGALGALPALVRLIGPQLGWGALSALGDSIVVAAAYAIALELRFGGQVPTIYMTAYPRVILPIVAVYVGANVVHRVYRRAWRYAGLHDVLVLTQATAISTGMVLLPTWAFLRLWHPIPVSVIPIGGLLALTGMATARLRHRLVLELTAALGRTPQRRLLIIGAGNAGQRLAHELLTTPALGYRPVGFIDDDHRKEGDRLHGLPVLGSRYAIAGLVRQLRVEVIALAIPSLATGSQREMLALCEDCEARIKVVPGLPELLNGGLDGPFRDVRLEELLGRPPVSFAYGHRASTSESVVLITGAAGSIGSELARQIAARGTERLILLDTNESGLFDLAMELEPARSAGVCRIDVIIADVRDARRISQVFDSCRPSVVFHVAAYKHVPLMEVHPGEAVLTNVVGTLNVCTAAQRAACERVVFISTDKAVNAENVMGATKRIGEHIIQAFASTGQTTFCAVRFGNVLGSRGSVVPTFERQLRRGGPLTVTHAEATRYFMTIPEAASLIIEATAQAEGGEIFILDMGNPIRIADLAYKMIRMHGLRPHRDIDIVETGLRAGEKLHEALTSDSERLLPTRHPRVSRVLPLAEPIERAALLEAVEHLRLLAEDGLAGDRVIRSLFSLAAAEEVRALGARGGRHSVGDRWG